MSRSPRFSYSHAVHHVTLRCNNREFLFTVPSFELFLHTIQQSRREFPLSLYNYCLMTNHVHLLFKVGRDDTLSKAMHWISSTFSHTFNKLTGRRGHLWEGRFRSTIIEENSYFFRCMAYVDLNPVRAEMVSTPLEYRWCGHRALRDGNSGALDFHTLYLDAGADPASRYRSYMEILEEEARRPAVPLATTYFVGSERFVKRLVKRFGLNVSGVQLTRNQTVGDGSADVICVSRFVGKTRTRNVSGRPN